jgi:hypothetical protein
MTISSRRDGFFIENSTYYGIITTSQGQMSSPIEKKKW